MNPKLKPCPFCGGVAFIDVLQKNKVEIKCLKCPAKIEAIGILRTKDAVKAWNRRPK